MNEEKPNIMCKYGDNNCGVYYYCDKCEREARALAYKRLTPQQKAYDKMVDPLGAYHEDFDYGCSCHISAPCSYCTRETED